MSTDVMIEANGLSKRFGPVRALDKVNFKVRKGEVVGFLGPNGAGKSTTMRILTCFISPSAGAAKVHGHDVFDSPLDVRRSLGYLPQRAPIYQDMLVREYLEFTANVRGIGLSRFKKQLKKATEVCGLAQALNKEIGTLSHGYRQRVGLAQALIHDPPILILDEPTSDLDPNEKAEVLRYIKEIGKDRTVLLSTHNLAEVEQACRRAIIVSKGRIVADGPLDEIRAKTGSVRYVVTFDEKLAEGGGKPPAASEIREALEKIDGALSVRELPSDASEHKLEVSGGETDLRAAIFRLAVARSWTLLELEKKAQSLDAVFRDLTRSEERLDRGEQWDEDEDEDDEDDEEDEDDEQSKKPADKSRRESSGDEDDEDEDEDDEDEDDEDEDEDDRAQRKDK